ncbi:methyltransferase domain-containing protein [Blastococcus sp. LR1]|uniref:methyltransferase domain-containing protein n=1 Tax=Blastococcus sp. LR1 TaxID=2877000 RepID=UPI001CCC0B48|nr:methyltransferase domain-containing protein [Blastococcus sp. LR1]MCA0146601.1 class I SAM-dependent methyltransferase [Blastococcus sp. LR1]
MSGEDLVGSRDIGDYLVSARSFDEYRAMFALSDEDVAGRVLDCPGGASSFTAAACALGARAVAVDPVYVTPAERLEERLSAELARGQAWAVANADRYLWDFFGDPAGHARHRADAAALFAADRRAHPERYVAATLPALPFADRSVDLVLSSHLLLTYADRLDAGFHVAALREMARVSRAGVRIYPLVDQAGRAMPELVAHLVDRLGDDGLRARVRPVAYEFQRGAGTMLEVLR